jgi:chemotaxis protein MotB
MRDRVSTLESDRSRLRNSLTGQAKDVELYKNAVALAQRRAELYALVSEKLRPLVDTKQIAIDTAKGKFLIRLGDEALFDPGRAELRPDGQALLREIAGVLKAINRDLLVACHTDPQALARGSAYKSNWELTTARAVAIVRFFQGEGVDPRRLGAAGYSEFSYLGDADADGKPQNRRIELVMMPGADELLPLPLEVIRRVAPDGTKNR